jgi:GxxExxY protein
MDIEEVAKEIVDAAIKVHRTLGPGLFESTYQKCLAHELRKRGLRVECEVVLPVIYDGVEIESGFRMDMLVENMIVVENKTVDRVAPINSTQLQTYLRLGGFKLGFLLNWKVTLMKHGIYRIINPSFNFVGEKDLPQTNPI